jgi:hypothetical protein
MRSFALRYSAFAIPYSFFLGLSQTALAAALSVSEVSIKAPISIVRSVLTLPPSSASLSLWARRDRRTVTGNSWGGVGALGREAEP